MGATGKTTEYNINALNKRKYRGIWYGANKNPITEKQLLDKVIQQGRGFSVTKKYSFSGDTLLDDGTIKYYLTDESGRGRFELSNNSLHYLKAKLNPDNWIYNKVVEYIGK